jgi:5-methylcytosine-specific restriction endonuclease McrA
MGYKDPLKQKAYQRRWISERRRAYLDGKSCVQCGCSEVSQLEVDHINREEKVSHRIWSWSEARRHDELRKCQVLCRACHIEKTAQENSKASSHRPRLRGRYT